MRRKLIYAMMLMFSMTAVLSSCSNDTDLFDPTAADKVQHNKFKEAFENTFGKVAPDVDWGFNDTEATAETRGVSRIVVMNPQKICALTPSQIEELPEDNKRACLRMLIDYNVNIGTDLTIEQLAAFGFKRIICEDLNVSENSDFDYNDAVFDAKRMEEAGDGQYATFYTVLRAEGAHKSIQIGDAEGKYEVHEAFGVSKQMFINTVNKDRPVNRGAYWIKEKNPVVKIIEVAKRDDGKEPTLIDIPVLVEGNVLPLTAIQGEPAEKICVDLDYSWLEERVRMKEWYPEFSHYATGTAYSNTYDAFGGGQAWWRATDWYGNYTPEPIPTPIIDDEDDPTPPTPVSNPYPKVIYNDHFDLTIGEKFGAEVESETRNGEYVTVAFKSAPTAVADRAFVNELYLWGMTIPSMSIGEKAFEYCTSMNTFSMNGSGSSSATVTIGKEAFKNCTALQNFVFSSTLCDIGKNAFENCNKLTTVDIPSSILKIDDYAFKNCEKLEHLRIGQGLIDNNSYTITIGKNAFQGCTSLKTVTCLALEPPVIFTDCPFDNTVTRIEVPAQSLLKYKTTWTQYADIIVGLYQ